MFYPPSINRYRTTIVVCTLCPLMQCFVSAQVMTTPSASPAPLGLRGGLPIDNVWNMVPMDGFKGGFGCGIGVQSIYDSNFFLAEHHPKSELSTNFLPWLGYSTDTEGATPLSVSANYMPNIRSYLHNSDLGGVDHSGGVTLKVAGAKTAITSDVNYNTVSGVDRLSGTFVNGSIMTSGIRGTYLLGPRTSLLASWKLGISDYGSSSLVGSDNYTTELGGLWAATEHLSFGPGIRYMLDESSNTGTRDTWAFSMQSQYLVDNRIRIMASLGGQCAANSRDTGGTTMGITGDLVADYTINDRMRLASAIRYVTVPSPTDVNYVINNLTISTVVTRQILSSSVSLGLEMNVADYVDVGPVGTRLDKQDNLGAILTYSRGLFLDRVDFESSLRYTLNDGRYDWTQLQVSAGIKIAF